ncbi:MAG: hypothetical protein V7K68_02205 [Nostoc sp.]|uniref:hypothetical protein n=1 Tax=Nostoc sp. TaxID=1180 RepID=UPI002FF62080
MLKLIAINGSPPFLTNFSTASWRGMGVPGLGTGDWGLGTGKKYYFSQFWLGFEYPLELSQSLIPSP